MEKRFKFFISIILIFLFLIIALPKSVFAAGIVPCGRDSNSSDTTWDDKAPCGLCHLFILINRAISGFLVPLAIALVGLMAIVGGVLFITAAGDPGRIMAARRTITGAIIGLIIVLLSWVIVNTIVVFATNNTKGGIGIITGVPWNEIDCPVP